jgi:cytochrome c1
MYRDRNRIIVALSFSLLAGVWRGWSLGAARELPEGEGAGLVKEKCLGCHEADLIVQQRLSHAAWTREVEKMIRWGAQATDAEKQTMVNYLAVHFGVRPVFTPSASSLERGRAVFRAKCLACHEADLTEQQRLSRSGWTREVDKMIRWGADLPADEKDPLIEFLSSQYSPVR